MDIRDVETAKQGLLVVAGVLGAIVSIWSFVKLVQARTENE